MNYRVGNPVYEIPSDAKDKGKIIEISNVPGEFLLFAAKSNETFLKGFSIWLVLKNETTSGIIHNYKKQLPALASKYRFSIRSFTKYIPWLIKEDLLHLQGDRLILHSYSALRKYKLSIERRVSIEYTAGDRYTLPEIISSIVLA